jgi:ubiquinone/menaquinone biosynthesis C-methylase UbiE
MDIEQQVARHYGHSGAAALEEAILAALTASGKDADRLAAADLSDADEFHVGGRPATEELGRDLAFAAGMHVLDVGSGVGGPARYFAETHGCQVTGIDLSQEYVELATALTRRCGLAERVSFRRASALAMPFGAATFDGATLIHVGMNIADKGALFAELARVLKPEARLGVYDVVRTGEAALPYPMPWAESPATSFLERAATYRRLLAAAGFALEQEHDRRDLALAVIREMRARIAQHGPPALGLHLVMGPSARERARNITAALERGDIAPVAFVARRLP